MRHSLMRMWHATGLDARWYVPAGDPSVFNITYVLLLQLSSCTSRVALTLSRSQEAQVPRACSSSSLAPARPASPPSHL